MSDLDKARDLFHEAGLAFPTLPSDLSARLYERDRWVFSTRADPTDPYDIDASVKEFDDGPVEDYALLAHSGHGVNSYAVQYYLVHGSLGLFLHLAWGGVYVNADAAAIAVAECFALADRLVSSAATSEQLGAMNRLEVVGCDFYGSHWSVGGRAQSADGSLPTTPADVLRQAVQWLSGTGSG